MLFPWVRRILEKDSFVTWYHLCHLYNDVNQFVLLASIILLVALLKVVHTEILGGCTYISYSASVKSFISFFGFGEPSQCLSGL